MADRAPRSDSSLSAFQLTRCCAEAQADGVPCPTLGRACEACERAVRDVVFDAPIDAIRPAGND